MKRRDDGTVDFTGVSLETLISNIYALSKPQGMGYIHYRPGPIPQEHLDYYLKEWKKHGPSKDRGIVFSLDYVAGRACKFVLRYEKKGGELLFYSSESWFDHTDGAYEELYNSVMGVTA